MATLHLTNDLFDEHVRDAQGIALVDFWAPWCGPCKMLGPIVEQVGDEVQNVVIGKVNIDEESGLASEFGVMSIPTVILFKNGMEVSRKVGMQSKQGLLEMLGTEA